MFPIALTCGIRALDYWDMTYLEIMETIYAYREQERIELQKIATMNHKLSQLIAIGFNSPKDMPTIYDAYPSLFEKPVETKQDDWRIMKDRISAFAQVHNRKLAEGGENGTR